MFPACAIRFGTKAVYDRAYFENVTLDPGHSRSGRAPAFAHARPVHEVVPVDVFVPGCPPSADVIFYTLSELLEGRQPELSRERALELRRRMEQRRTIVIDPVTRIEGHAKITSASRRAGPASKTPAFTSPSFAALRSFAKVVRSPRCRL